jgi:sterol desaturase/sphingolipid hydroxylase (fatty acid hydroxylase superfamily)
MNILEKIGSEVLSFFRVQQVYLIFQKGGVDALLTFEGITSSILCLTPFILLYEMSRSLFVLKKGIHVFIVPLLIDLVNRIFSRLISISVGSYMIILFKPYAILKTELTWYWFIYGYAAWELGHYIYHYICHRVRFFWCLHSSHHANESINMSVNYSHFFLEGPFADSIRVSTCILLGVSPSMLALIVVIDWIWAEFNHISEETLKNARLGVFGNFILTPSHHRVHHSRNQIYLDKNFGNLLNIWDKLFQTYQKELQEVKPEYGITRKVNPYSFWDVYFGEIIALTKDVYLAPGLRNKLLYLIMPPGWKHNSN